MKKECAKDSVEYNGKSYPCTVSLAMDLVGGKWKAVILYHLVNGGRRYGELRREMPAITEMTLSLQLKQLEEDGIVSREVLGHKAPIKVFYSLTALGKTFVPALNAITRWGNMITK